MHNKTILEDVRLLYEAVYNEDLKTIADEYNNLVALSNIVEDSSNYFYNIGLNEEGLIFVIEALGIDTFVDFIFDLSTSNLNETNNYEYFYELFDYAMENQPLYETPRNILGNIIQQAVQRGTSDYQKLREFGRKAEQSQAAKAARKVLTHAAADTAALATVAGQRIGDPLVKAAQNYAYQRRGRYRNTGSGEKEEARSGGVSSRSRGPIGRELSSTKGSPYGILPPSTKGSSYGVLPPSTKGSPYGILFPFRYGKPDESGQGNLFDYDKLPKAKLGGPKVKVTAPKRPKSKTKKERTRQGDFHRKLK